ncbi:MAG: hypothetical protein K6G18_17125 [Treponema sp.]|nr:hypothetical protein [Treponema sp.]
MMELFDDAKERIRSFIEENSKLTATVIALFVLLVLGGLFALMFGGRIRAKKKLPAEDFTKREDFFPPQQASLTDDYYFSRVTGEKWSNEERDRWFTVPDEQNIKKLGEANDAISDKILEAAP